MLGQVMAMAVNCVGMCTDILPSEIFQNTALTKTIVDYESGGTVILLGSKVMVSIHGDH